MMRRIGWMLTAVVAATGLIGSGLAPVSAQDGSDRLKVVATFSVLGDIVQNVGGDRVEVITMVGANGDAHTYEPSPQDIAKLMDAAIIFENGLEFETWLDDIYDASGTSATRIIVTSAITPRAMDEAGHDDHADEHADEEHAGEAGGDHASEEEHADESASDHAEEEHADEAGADHADEDHSAEGDHKHGEFDPHVWHDVQNVIAMVATISDALIAADPDHADVYTTNAQAYTAQLQELDAWIETEVAKIPEQNRKLVTSHDTFGYFADRYGFEVIGTALNSVTTEVGDPAAGEIADLVAEIEAAGVPAIFAENVHNTDLMESIAREAGVTLAPSLFTDALGDEDSGGATYVEMMRTNVGIIVTALSA